MTDAKKIPTIGHDEPLVAGPNGQIPPYEISEWAKDKTADQLDDRLVQMREEARRGPMRGLVGHEYLTMEMLAAERRLTRSPADLASDPTPAEQKRLDAAEAAYHAAKALYDQADHARTPAGRRLAESIAKAEGRAGDRTTWEQDPSSMPESVREQRNAVAAAQSAFVRADKDLGEAQVRWTNVRLNIDARRDQRRTGAQGETNRAGFLENLRRYGGEITSEVKDAMKRAYGR